MPEIFFQKQSLTSPTTRKSRVGDDPGSRKYVMKWGTKYSEKIMDSSKVAFSVMFTRNAEGNVLPPYVLYKSVHLYDHWVKGGLVGAKYNQTNSDWFDEETFTRWFSTMMLPKLCIKEGKKVIIGDTLSLHLSQSVIDAFSQHNITFGNAEDNVLPPYVEYKSIHLYNKWVNGGLAGAR